MKHAEMQLSETNQHRRWDASYLLLSKEHSSIVGELTMRLSRDELVQLAKDLPFNERAANAVCPRMQGFSGPAEFATWLDGKKTRGHQVAVYLAAAAQAAHRVFAEEVLALKLEILEKVKHWSGVMKVLTKREAAHTLAAIKRRD